MRLRQLLTSGLLAAIAVMIPVQAEAGRYNFVGKVAASDTEPAGSSWFDTWHGMRFLMEKEPQRRGWSPLDLVKMAEEMGRSLKVEFDSRTGKFNPEIVKVEYAVCSLELLDLRVETSSCHRCSKNRFAARWCSSAALNRTQARTTG